MKTIITTPEQIARLYLNEMMTNRIVKILPKSSQTPKYEGKSYYWTTPSGNTIINHPKAYHWPMRYHASTRHITVGDRWIHNVSKRLTSPPKGMRWKRKPFDDIYLERISDGMDFHPSAKDLSRKNFSTYTRREMAANYTKRQETIRLINIQNKQLESSFVFLEDSCRAGNCIEGSLKFAEQHLGLTREEILSAPFLIGVKADRLLATKNERARSAVIQAWKRETIVSI